MGWRRHLLRIGLLAVLLATRSAAAQGVEREVAVTFDDLPFASVPADDDATLRQTTEKLLRALQSHHVPAIGFVNGYKLYQGGALSPARIDLLQNWLDAGFELGNHTFSHVSIDTAPLDAYEADLLRDENEIRPMMERAGHPLRWFRHPYLNLGRDPVKYAGLAAFLSEHGYETAPVTINSAEWQFAVAYARAQARGDEAMAKRIGDAYVPYMTKILGWAEGMALDLFGRPIRHVLLLHANSLNADYFPALADMLERRGYRFVTLAEAVQDPVYTRSVLCDGGEGESWIERWSLHVGLQPQPQPPAPSFVIREAGFKALDRSY